MQTHTTVSLLGCSFISGYESKIKGVLQNDEIIQALKNDPTSTEFISQRVREVVEETIITEKDRYIQGLFLLLNNYLQSS